jgi:hypothetical protein
MDRTYKKSHPQDTPYFPQQRSPSPLAFAEATAQMSGESCTLACMFPVGTEPAGARVRGVDRRAALCHIRSWCGTMDSHGYQRTIPPHWRVLVVCDKRSAPTLCIPACQISSAGMRLRWTLQSEKAFSGVEQSLRASMNSTLLSSMPQTAAPNSPPQVLGAHTPASLGLSLPCSSAHSGATLPSAVTKQSCSNGSRRRHHHTL